MIYQEFHNIQNGQIGQFRQKKLWKIWLFWVLWLQFSLYFSQKKRQSILTVPVISSFMKFCVAQTFTLTRGFISAGSRKWRNFSTQCLRQVIIIYQNTTLWSQNIEFAFPSNTYIKKCCFLVVQWCREGKPPWPPSKKTLFL